MLKKVGVISMQRVNNFGSFLQAYGLKRMIESFGCSCEFVDIKAGSAVYKTHHPIKRVSYLSKLDKYLLKRVNHYFFAKRRNNNFINIYSKWLGLGTSTNWNKYYDIVIIGSDEVFNCLQQSKWGLSPNLFGGSINAANIITYAASCGHTTYEKVKELGLVTMIRELLKNINEFSVRDENTGDFVERITGKNPIFHLDPVFIYDYLKENSFVEKAVNIHKYLLIYAYDGRISNKEEIKNIIMFARKHKLRAISVGLYQSWCDKNIEANPFELLEYIKSAAYIVTDTFHGSVFAVKYNKQFITIVRESNREKINDLLVRFGLESRLLKRIEFLSSLLEEKIEYSNVNDFIEIEKNRSREYLMKNINNA